MQCSVTGDLGFAKPQDVAQEKICSDLARRLGLNVPEIRIDDAEGFPKKVAVSVAFGKESADVRLLREQFPDLFVTPAVQGALRAASGLLPFHTWVGTGDLKDDHLLYSVDENNQYSIAAIDFASALGPQLNAPIGAAPGPPALTAAVDKQVVEEVTKKIETLPPSEISRIVESLPEAIVSKPEKDRIVQGLQSRQSQLRAVLKAKGWLP